MTASQLWTLFTAQAGIPAETPFSAWHFCDNEADAEVLADLVFAGVKRATASCLWVFDYDNEPVPQAGDYSVILGWNGDARGVIQTTAVDFVPFGAVTEEFAATEGEGDKTLAYWKRAHTSFFTRECARIGKVFSDEMPVVCERFSAVYAAPKGE